MLKTILKTQCWAALQWEESTTVCRLPTDLSTCTRRGNQLVPQGTLVNLGQFSPLQKSPQRAQSTLLPDPPPPPSKHPQKRNALEDLPNRAIANTAHT